MTTDRLTLLGLLALTLLTVGCVSGTDTLFQSGFDSNSLGAPPAVVQTTGTALGTGASGSLDYRVPLSNLARQMGALKVWMGSPWGGTFEATDLLVSYQPPRERLSSVEVPPECVAGNR